MRVDPSYLMRKGRRVRGWPFALLAATALVLSLGFSGGMIVETKTGVGAPASGGRPNSGVPLPTVAVPSAQGLAESGNSEIRVEGEARRYLIAPDGSIGVVIELTENAPSTE